MDAKERRVLERYNLERTVEIKAGHSTHFRELNDISGSGASVHGNTSDFDDEVTEMGADDLGKFTASVVRKWDDGFAVEFDIEDGDRYSLQEDLEAFRRENDLMPE